MDDLERGALLVRREKLEYAAQDLRTYLNAVGMAMKTIGAELVDRPDLMSYVKLDAPAESRGNSRGRAEWTALPDKAEIALKLQQLHEAVNGLYEVNSALGAS